MKSNKDDKKTLLKRKRKTRSRKKTRSKRISKGKRKIRSKSKNKIRSKSRSRNRIYKQRFSCKTCNNCGNNDKDNDKDNDKKFGNKKVKEKRNVVKKRNKRKMGRPSKSRREAWEDLIKRCKERNIEVKNRRTGKYLSEETLRHRCTYKNAPDWGGKGDPNKPILIRKRMRKRRQGVPFKKAPRILPETFKPRKESIESVTINRSPERESPEPRVSPLIDSRINKRRTVNPTLIIRQVGSEEDNNQFAGSARVVRIPKGLTRSEKLKLINTIRNMR